MIRPTYQAVKTATAQLMRVEKGLPHICAGAGKFKRLTQSVEKGKLVPIRKPLADCKREEVTCGCVVRKQAKADRKAAALAAQKAAAEKAEAIVTQAAEATP